MTATQPEKLARAGARARPASIELEVLRVRLSQGNRAHGLALVDVRIGPVVATYGYMRLRRQGRWQARPPVDGDGKEALCMPKKLEDQVVQLVREAAEGDDKIRDGLRRWW